MTIENLERAIFAVENVLPVVKEASELFGRLISGGIGMGAAKAQLRNILVVGYKRLDAAEKEDEARDAENDARVKHAEAVAEAVSTVTKPDEDTKP